MRLGALFLVVVCGLGVVICGNHLIRTGTNPADPGQSPVLLQARRERLDAEQPYARHDYGAAEQNLRRVVDRYRKSGEPLVQDQVGVARLRLGYAAARQGDFRRARDYFRTAQAEYRGTGFKTPDFGGVEDQAAYQAAVCLQAIGKKDHARREFEAFLREHRASPLAKAAHRRLVMIDPARRDTYDELLQHVLDQQDAAARLERASCGPKALAYLLERLGKNPEAHEDLAAECGTTADGTTLAAIKKALAKRGLPTFGYELALTDFRRMPLPALWLAGEHYLVVVGISGETATVYDPLRAEVRREPLPSNQPQFLATVLCLAPVSLQEVSR